MYWSVTFYEKNFIPVKSIMRVYNLILLIQNNVLFFIKVQASYLSKWQFCFTDRGKYLNMLNVEEQHNSYFHWAQKYLTTLHLPTQRAQSTLYFIQQLVPEINTAAGQSWIYDMSPKTPPGTKSG